jgi:hypothetical protein
LAGIAGASSRVNITMSRTSRPAAKKLLAVHRSRRRIPPSLLGSINSGTASREPPTPTPSRQPPASPTVVKVGNFVADIVDLDEVNETFAAELVNGAEWMDTRLAFDPVEMGADQKLLQGSWQFDEVFAG